MRPFIHTTALLLALTMLLSTGCLTPVLSEKTELRQTVTQQARMAPATGPESVGTLTPSGQVSLQGGFQYAHVNTVEDAEEESTLGHLVQAGSAQGRISFGLGGNTELGLAGRYSRASWARATSDITPEQDTQLDTAHLFYGGAQLRTLVVDHRLIGLALLFEGSLSQNHYRRDVRETTRTITTYADGREERSPLQVREYSESGAELFFNAKGGLQLFAHVAPGVTLHGGLLAQNYRRYWAQRSVGETCNTLFGETSTEQCQGDTIDDLSRYNPILLGTIFWGASVEVPLMPLSLHLQVYHNTFGPELVSRAQPGGADLALRLTF